MRWLAPWEAIADPDWPERVKTDRIARLTAQLTREVGPHHVLRGVEATPIACRSDDPDDVLFRLGNGRVAEVHVTWRRGEEPDPRWPATCVFASVEEWARERMEVRHAEWLLVNGGDQVTPS